jgi:hypothetical protein
MDLGISNRQSSSCQQIATIPENEFDNHLQEIKVKKSGTDIRTSTKLVAS